MKEHFVAVDKDGRKTGFYFLKPLCEHYGLDSKYWTIRRALQGSNSHEINGVFIEKIAFAQRAKHG
jgi:hypothetical protein